MSFTEYIRLGDSEMHLKHPKILYLRTSSTNFHLLKGTSLEKKSGCVWGEKVAAARQILEKKKKKKMLRFISRPWRWQEHPGFLQGSWMLRLHEAGGPVCQAPVPLEAFPSCCPRTSLQPSSVDAQGQSSILCQTSCSASPSQGRRFGWQPLCPCSSQRTGEAWSQLNSQ